MDIFRSNKKKTSADPVQQCANMVRAFYKKHKLNINDFRLPRQENGWWIQRGSAVIYILISPHEKSPSIRIVSPILYLPEDFILPFYRRCLELNMELMNCAIGVSDDKVSMVSERPIAGLDQEELESMIGYLSAVADEMDDKLAAEFKAKLYIHG
ncbi:MAG: YbjN domain-containing protein [Chloroflexi bacterium]|nr:YbjN domain-containing protein [Chloroflexota bacterium]